MKKKVCKYLDSNLFGELHIINNQVHACTPKCCVLLDNVKISELNVSDIQKQRQQFYENLNKGLNKTCEKCTFLIEKDEENIDIGKLSNLILHPYTTCNLHCNYCVLSEEKLKKKLLPNENHLLNKIKDFYNNNLFKKDFSIALGGGEPSLIEDLKEIAQFLNNLEGKINLTLITNSSISNRIDYVISSLSNTPNIHKIINTSLDSGTRETYKLLKNRDLFESTCNNLRKYAKSNIFSTIILKYVMMNDNSNINKKDLKGFINFSKEIKNITNANIQVIIDADMTIQKEGNDYFDESEIFKYIRLNKEQLRAAAYLYYNLKDDIKVLFCGGRINSERSLEGKLDVERIKNIANRKIYIKKLFRIMNFIKIQGIRDAL